MQHFGEHLIVDGYEGDETKLNDKNLILDFLQKLPQKLEMKILAGPQVFKAEANGQKDPGGWTGFVIIAESHISIHTFPKRGFVSADIYTCKNGINSECVFTLVKETFELKHMDTNILNRGLQYPENNIYQ